MEARVMLRGSRCDGGGHGPELNKERNVVCTLWENYVDEYLKLYEREKEGTNIIIVQFCKSSIFNGIIRACNVINVTKLLLNADIPEINDFRQRIEAKSNLNTSNNSSISHGTKSSLSDKFCDGMMKIKTIKDLFDDDESAWVIATIDHINCSYGWSYFSCKRCTKKLIKADHQFYYKGCNAYDSSATLRYKIKVHVKDDTGRAPFLIWDRECKQVIGKTAAELENNSKGEGVDNLPEDIVITMLNQKFLFKVDGYSVSKLISNEKVISTYSTSCLDSQESNCISNMEGSKIMKNKVEDDTLMETSSSKGVGNECCHDEQVKRSLDDAFSATKPQKKRIINIKKEKL
ncbi:hypothetical protein C2S53_002575 [Perilla frutescens var. hirtella]|uniref:Replication factor A C-terminal domain-containing protein n=1 Tax=Perilla frutescens var. hirtella TaxID=608512 RepID=A0AAD4ISB7_PERFH|nr:hypothetical protein C2S53_002575 [Perilla frutescens var. hirtella]